MPPSRPLDWNTVTLREAVRRAVLSNLLRPGTPLSEAVLAPSLGVDPDSLCLVLDQLAAEGIVALSAGAFCVTKIDTAMAFSAQLARQAIECAGVRIAATRRSDADILRLREIIAYQQMAIDHRELVRFRTLDQAFHRRLYRASGHQLTWRLTPEADHHLLRVMNINHRCPNWTRSVISDHTHIVDAVQNGDPEAADGALRAHLEKTLASLPELQRVFPQHFA
jgi:DNA-binding GntR family transcriptional regulator